MSVSSLPNDVWVHVLSLLEPEDLVQLTFTSKHMNYISSGPAVWSPKFDRANWNIPSDTSYTPSTADIWTIC
jgi:F-box domain